MWFCVAHLQVKEPSFYVSKGMTRFYLDNITIGDELGLKTFGGAGELFQGLSRKPDAIDQYQQGGQVQDQPEAATAVEVLEVGGEGSEDGEC